MFSDNWFALLALSVVALLYVLIWFLGRKGFNWNLLLVFSLVAGIFIGLLFCDEGWLINALRVLLHDESGQVYFTDNLQYVSLIGRVYIGITEALVAPLILLAILSSVMSLGNSHKLKTLGTRSLFWLLFNTAISIVLTIGVSILVGVGKNTNLTIEGVSATKYEGINTQFIDVLEGFFPHNIFNELAQNKVVPIIITALVLAVAYLSFDDKEKLETFYKGVEALKGLIFKVVGFVVDLIPFAILAIGADAAGTIGGRWDTIQPLLVVILVIIGLCLFQTFIVGGLFVKFGANLNPVIFFRKLMPAMMAGFSTQSTIAALPMTISRLVTKIGVKEEVGNFTATLGSTIGMPGCSGIWPITLAIFAVNFLGISYTPMQYVTLGLIALAVSFGTAGVAGTAVITVTAVYTTAGLPLEVFVLLFPISFIVGMFRTPTNVSCAAAAAVIVARQTGALDEDVFYERAPQELVIGK
ncbi:dicarboxylate/amino acid:cation symporter [Lachnospiraceae bacterium ZAX-1]